MLLGAYLDMQYWQQQTSSFALPPPKETTWKCAQTSMSWKRMLQDLLRQADDPCANFYSFATATASGIPHVRTVVHRGFVGEADETSSEDSSTCLLTTTDLRSGKAREIVERTDTPVEIAWYFSAPRVQVRWQIILIQFRIRGHAYLLPYAAHEARAQFPDAQLAPRAESFNWDLERARLWSQLSERMRASFAGPAPGKPLGEEAPALRSVEDVMPKCVYHANIYAALR